MTPEQRAYRLYRKARLLGELTLLVRCMEFYTAGRILGLIREPQAVTSS